MRKQNVDIAGILAVAALIWPIAQDAAMAQDVVRAVDNPRVLQPSSEPRSKVLMNTLEPAAGPAREKLLDLNIVYTASKLFNPATNSYDKVKLRSYNGTDVSPDVPYVSPTIEAAPGHTIRINLNNQLPGEASCTSGGAHPNEPHCFNGTNLHAHGLWINPAGNGDNVLLSINPGVGFQYEYNIPSDHPAGTYWYHTHRHGSTALQVSSGMAGALIIRGDRLPTHGRSGDLDVLLKPLRERVQVFQQIQYACYEPGSRIPKTNPDGTYRCDEGDTGEIEDYAIFGPGEWLASGRYTSVNGAVLPTFRTSQGEVERWRLIHAGVRDTIALKFVKMANVTALPQKLDRAAAEKFIHESCIGATVPFHLVAADGLTMAAAQKVDVATLQPGYRFDGLVAFPESGTYCVINAAATRAGSVNGLGPPERLIGTVEVAPGQPFTDIDRHLVDTLSAAATEEMPTIAAAVTADLNDGLKLSKFTPHPDIADSEVTGQQELTFQIDTSGNPPVFGVSNSLNPAERQPYDPDRLDRKLALGAVEEWTLQSRLASHPFHIHVNPFQIISIIDPNGKDVSASDAIDNYSPTGTGVEDPQYRGLKNVWKDTLWIKSLATPGSAVGMYRIKIRTRYQRYIGAFVLHCHILDHEDQGMMQNIAIVLPDGNVNTLNSPQAVNGQQAHRH
ncbi:multicopper oxidase type 2 [Rhizobium sp. CF080]|uniref:multicopper oxidase family protein n=1 Tax=Rhizobium sp. (strain CF080) TaxID=1144310 RepID=UPI00027189E7|nr:multicopper oxidase domain-containing protein [Rhizobium sp. CF080]EUB99409.1 multicopper oxidase type 2 [Rhizobium sp. CF080]